MKLTSCFMFNALMASLHYQNFFCWVFNIFVLNDVRFSVVHRIHVLECVPLFRAVLFSPYVPDN